MTDPGDVLHRRALLVARAHRCQQLADDITRRRLVLVDRLSSIRSRHTIVVWDSRAATASRDRLARFAESTVGQVSSDLVFTVERLRAEADQLFGQARRLDREASVLEAGEQLPGYR